MEYVISSDGLTVTVSSLGAELQRITDRSGERLYNGDPAFWTGRAPVLFPWCGGMKDDMFTYEGRKYSVTGKHGFARTSDFRAESVQSDKLVFLLDKKVPEYPFEYEFRVIYRVYNNILDITYETRNISGSRNMYFGTGAHEALSCPGGIEGCELRFKRKYDLVHSLLSGALLSGEKKPIAFDTDTLPLHDEYFTQDALVFRDLGCDSVTLHRRDGHGAEVQCPGFDHLLIWTKPGAPYICIEPWTNPPEYVTGSEDITQKSGIITLPPLSQDVRRHTIRFF